MKKNRGFSLVELLAVVLILAVLAAVAVPLYLNTRKTSAARSCKANINAIASAEAAWALRTGLYVSMTSLIGSGPEGLSGEPKCPLTNVSYSGLPGTTSAGPITISCTNASTHNTDLNAGGTTDWYRTMATIVSESVP